MMRVAYCFHDVQPSGASVWLRNHLLKVGDRKTALVVLPGPSPMEEGLRDAGFAVEVMNLRMGDLSGSGPLTAVPMLFNRVRGLAAYRTALRAHRPDIIYANSSYQVAPMLTAAMLGVPLFVHVHEGWRSRTHGMKRWLIRRLAGGAAFAARQGIELFGPPPAGARWEFSPNGVDPALAEIRQQRRAAERKRLGLEEHHAAVVFLGILSRRKGFHDLVGAWEEVAPRHPDARLLVGGRLDPWEEDPVIRQFPEAPPKGASHLGFVDDPAGLFAAADLFVLPSYGEAMPISISEAMMAGVPVVARNVGDVEFQLGDERGFLFEGEGPAVLVEALEQALRDTGEANRRAGLAQSFAREHLAEERQHRQIMELLEATAAGAGARGRGRA